MFLTISVQFDHYMNEILREIKQSQQLTHLFIQKVYNDHVLLPQATQKYLMRYF